MPRKLITPFKSNVGFRKNEIAPPHYEPYRSEASNKVYNLLFCDQLAASGWKSEEDPPHWKRILLSTPVDIPAMQELACDLSQEGRIRHLAFSRLREIGRSVPAKILLGVIIELPQPSGLNVLAAFCDGAVRYLNQSEKGISTHGATEIFPIIHKLFIASEALVAHIGPWAQPRLSPPVRGNVRLSFLVSDGLYFVEGPLHLMEDDVISASILESGRELLEAVMALAAG